MDHRNYWAHKAKVLLKLELKKRRMTYKQLGEKLGEIGVQMTTATLSSRISRAQFSAGFFIQCLEVVGCETLHLRIERQKHSIVHKHKHGILA
jgi:hypothetical protein